MPVDLSAVASQVGVDVVYQPTSGLQTKVIPQRIAVFGQGQTGVSYSSSKAQYTKAADAGAVYGYKSPIYLALRELLPTNGDGVGTIPVTVYPLSDAVSSVAASGDFTPSGTASKSGSYQLRIAGILGQAFVIPAGAVDVNLTLAKMGASLNAILQMPVTPSYSYGSVTASAVVGTGNGTIGTLSVAAPALPGAYKLVLNTAVVNGGVWTLTDPLGNVLSTTLTQTVGASSATAFSVNGLNFTVTDSTTDFAVGDTFTITVPATKMTVTAAWKGTSGNAIKLELLGPSYGVVFAVTSMANGLIDPDPTTALTLMGNVWETMLLNCIPVAVTTVLDTFQTFGEGRWLPTVKKPLVVFTGTVHSTVALATAVSSTRRTDRINALLSAPGSPDLPFVVAAKQLARIAVVANNNPPVDYCGQKAETIIPGDDSLQWDGNARDAAIKAGCSTIEVKDGVINVGDVVTFYAPTGEDPPAFRDVVDIVKLMNVVYNLNAIFSAPAWAAAPLIPDSQPTRNSAARKPKTAKAEAAGMVDGLGLDAILSDTASTKKLITASISSTNAKRLDISVPVKLSGNSKIKSATLYFSFYFGTPGIVG